MVILNLSRLFLERKLKKSGPDSGRISSLLRQSGARVSNPTLRSSWRQRLEQLGSLNPPF